MRIPAMNGLRLAAQRLRRRYVPSTLILLYHRIADVQPDPWSLCVTPRHFAEQLETLRQYSRPMQLRQLIRALADGHLPRRSVVITFGDGQADAGALRDSGNGLSDHRTHRAQARVLVGRTRAAPAATRHATQGADSMHQRTRLPVAAGRGSTVQYRGS